jgi:hypothetical protein
MKTEVAGRLVVNRFSFKKNKPLTHLFSKLNYSGILLAGILLANFQLQAGTINHPAIPILDEQGAHVLDSGKAYSPKMTCGTGGCHDYDAITSAFHFDMGRSEARDDYGKDHGISLLSSPGYFGGYNCMGRNNPDWLAKKSNASETDFADRGAAGWVQRCVSCHTGGGWMEKDRNGKRYDETDPATVTHLDGDYFNRGTDKNNQPASVDTVSQWNWKKSGVVEADCFLCHADRTAMIKADPQLTTLDTTTGLDTASDAPSHARALRRTMLVRQGHFRYAGSAILEFLNLNNTTDPLKDKTLLTFSRDTASPDAIHMRTKPNYALNLDTDANPVINWNAAAFDANRKVTIPMLRFPENENCMTCHRTSNSRRGFYGFGEGAAATYDEAGMLVEDYKDDVHKGLIWTENGESRPIENCNSCHSRNFYKPAHANVDLDANHNFLKGNSDMDLRNDLDYKPNALSCVYCHDTAKTPAIPSGHDSMLSAHLEKWKANGDMFGYTADSLSRITQAHFDVMNCQTCHITDKVGRRGKEIPIMYRYRQEEDGKLRITPYSQRDRIYWKDKNTGTILNKTERNSVFELRGGDTSMDGMVMPSKDMYGVIVDPDSGAELAKVSARMSHGSIRFGDPGDYAGWLALRNVYNKVFKKKGIDKAQAVMVLIESNQYIMSHNTRPSVESLQCADCHVRKQNGSFSALVANDSVLGTTNKMNIYTVADMRMISEGVIEFDKDYMKVEANADGAGGVVSINAADVLYSTRLNPSLSVLNADIAKIMSGKVNRHSLTDAAHLAGITNTEHIQTLFQQSGNELFVFSPTYGDPAIRKVAIMPMVNSQTELVFPTYQFSISLAGNEVVKAAANAGFGGLNAAVFSLQARDTNGDEVSNFGNASVWVKLPYTGAEASIEKIKLITSKDGKQWSSIDAANILLLNPQSATADGYLLFNTSHFSYYTITSADETNVSSANEASSTSSGGGSAPWLLSILAATYMLRFRKKKPITI